VPCWPDLWLHFKNLVPLMGTTVAIILYIVFSIFLISAPRLHTRWKIVTSRALGVVCLAPLVIALPAIVFGVALGSSGPPAQTRTVRSSDGQEARLSYQAGFLGRDYTEITLKRAGCCRHTVVFWHQGPSWFDDPKMDWLDNRHLQISYHSRPVDPQHCDQQQGDISIVCKPIPFANRLPADQSAQPSSEKHP